MSLPKPSSPLFAVESLGVELATSSGSVKVVDGLSFELAYGSSIGIVGESGSGKSQAALALMGLSSGRVQGQVRLANRDITQLTPRQRVAAGGHGMMAMVFQDALSSLNPYMTLGDQLTEVVAVREPVAKAEALRQAREALDRVGIAAADRRLTQYPHELSGGMRQRVMIAMALLMRPSVLIADEPTTALDPTLQQQVLRLFDALRRDLDMALILISHDLALVAQHCERLLVMYAGQCVESGLAADVLRAPAHPYTAALLACRPDGRRSPGVPLSTLPGSATGAARLTTCRFEPRCAMAESICSRPPTLEAITATRRVRCWRVHEQTGV